MYENELQKRIADLKTEIDNLPAGSVTKKTIEGKVYYYHRVSVSGKRTETYLDFDAVEKTIGSRTEISETASRAPEIR